MQPELKLCSAWLSSAAALRVPLLPSCMKVSLTGHTVLVRLPVESLQTPLFPGIPAEVWGQPDLYSLAGFIFLLWSLCVHSCIFCVSDFFSQQNWIQCISLPKFFFKLLLLFFYPHPRGFFVCLFLYWFERERKISSFYTCPELGSKPTI